jgi:type VI secretion system protein ImpF
MWSQPVPLELLLAADLDIETGHTRVRELRN